MAKGQRGRRVALIGVGVLLLAAGLGGGWVAAERFQSPEQRAAAASPPPAEPVVVEVREGLLEETITATADVHDASITNVAIPIVASPSVVTATPCVPGSPVAPGTVLVEVNGRPVFALPGAFPFYRDLTEGDRGPDVQQLQDALRALGNAIPERESGAFGSRTARAALTLYANAGYDRSLIVSERSEPADPGTADGAEAGVSSGDAAVPQTVPVVTLPLSDLVVIASLPLGFVTGPGVGSTLTAENATASLSTGELAVSSIVPPAVAAHIPAGSSAVLRDTTGLTVQADTGAVTGDPTATEMTLAFLVSEPIPPEWKGQAILATITLQTVGESSLIVPTRAIISGPSDTFSVLKMTDGGSLVQIPVEQIGTLAGQSAIAPLRSGALVTGDQVEVR